ATLLPYNPGGITKTRVLGKTPHSALPNRMTSIEEEEDLNAFFQSRLAGNSGEAREKSPVHGNGRNNRQVYL
ncbi:hypothetical protein MNBD_NITROSPIRAE03-1750, partial [hydrothermal vent metagenome]